MALKLKETCMFSTCLSGTNADIIKAGGYKLSALEIESVIIEASGYHFLIVVVSCYQPLVLSHFIFLYGEKLSIIWIFTFRTFLQHPAVSECCVLGLPDKDYGEIVSAIVVPEADVKRKQDQESKPVLSLEELSTWAKDKIAPYKVWQHGHCLCYISVRVYKIYQVRVWKKVSFI